MREWVSKRRYGRDPRSFRIRSVTSFPPLSPLQPLPSDLLGRSTQADQKLTPVYLLPRSSGKTELLNLLILTRILPSSFNFNPTSPTTQRTFPTPVHLGGSSLSCLVFSLSPSSPFSLLRLAHTLRSYILTRFDASAADLWPNISQRDRWTNKDLDVDSLVTQALSRVRVWKGNGGVGSWELAVGLKRVEEVVREEFGKEEELGLVAVDNFGEGFFQDGWEFLQRSRAGKDPSALQDVTTQPMYHVLKTLTSIRDNLGPLVVLTTQALLPSPPPPPSSIGNRPTINPFPKQHLAFPYVDPFLHPPPPPANTLVASTSAGQQPPPPPPPPHRTRPVPPEIRGLTHHITLLTPGERLKMIDLEKGLGGELRDEEKRAPRGKVRGILRVVGGVGGAREGRSWEIGVGKDGLEISGF